MATALSSNHRALRAQPWNAAADLGPSAREPSPSVLRTLAFEGRRLLGAVLLLDSGLWALWFQGALYTLAFGGAEDILYYWLDGRQITGVLPWLDRSRLIFVRPQRGDVTSLELLASAIFWVMVWVGLLVVLPRIALPLRRGARLTAKR